MVWGLDLEKYILGFGVFGSVFRLGLWELEIKDGGASKIGMVVPM